MRNVERLDLPEPGPTYFAEKTKLILKKRTLSSRCKEARRLWKQAGGRQAMIAAVDTLVKMNSALPWCMYCEADRASAVKKGKRSGTVDHWIPIKESPEKTFEWENHFLACSICNSLFKGSEFPRAANGDPLVIHLVDDPVDDHLEFEPSNGALVGTSPKGQSTIQFFHLTDLNGSRYDVWTVIIAHIGEYDAAHAAGDHARMATIREFVRSSRHRSVVNRLLSIALGPNGAALTSPNFPALLVLHGVAAWL